MVQIKAWGLLRKIQLLCAFQQFFYRRLVFRSWLICCIPFWELLAYWNLYYCLNVQNIPKKLAKNRKNWYKFGMKNKSKEENVYEIIRI